MIISKTLLWDGVLLSLRSVLVLPLDHRNQPEPGLHKKEPQCIRCLEKLLRSFRVRISLFNGHRLLSASSHSPICILQALLEGL